MSRNASGSKKRKQGGVGGSVMQVFLLAAAVSAVFVTGCFLMKKLDDFLENIRRANSVPSKPGKVVLRIGFSNPLVADGISGVLEQYSKQHLDISVSLFYGDTKDLLKKVGSRKLEIAFLPEQADIPSDQRYNRIKIMLPAAPVIMKYGGLPIEPIAEENVTQTVVWMEETETSAAKCFMEYMKDGIRFE